MQYNFKNKNIIKQFKTQYLNFKINVTISIRVYILLVMSISGIRYIIPSLKGQLPSLVGINFPLISTIPSQEGITIGESGSMPYLPGVCHGKAI